MPLNFTDVLTVGLDALKTINPTAGVAITAVETVSKMIQEGRQHTTQEEDKALADAAEADAAQLGRFDQADVPPPASGT